MSFEPPSFEPPSFEPPSCDVAGLAAPVLVIGAGGIGAPLLWTLAQADRPISLVVCDDDQVEESNLHRQILFDDADIGADKLEATRRALAGSQLTLEPYRGRFEPASALALAQRAALVVDASDNFATRFLAADAAFLAGKPLVSAAAVRLSATVFAAAPSGDPCYRCLFEDLPEGDAPDCATAGVLGMVCGVAGAIAANHVLRFLHGDLEFFGSMTSFDGRRDRLRTIRIRGRSGCPLCGVRTITDLDEQRYSQASCDLV